MISRLKAGTLAVALMLAGVSAHAALITSTGSRNNQSTTAPNLATDTDAASTAFRAWDSFVVISGTENFSGIPLSEPSDIDFPFIDTAVGRVTCGIPGASISCSTTNVPAAGRYDTTGDAAAKFLNFEPTASSTSSTSTWDLGGVQAFSFMLTDAGDFGGDFSVTIELSDGSTISRNLVAQGTATTNDTDPTNPKNAGLVFFGMYNDQAASTAGLTFVKVTFSNGNSRDGFAVDDLRVGRFDTSTGGGGGTAPEPAGLALALAALGAAGLARRRRTS